MHACATVADEGEEGRGVAVMQFELDSEESTWGENAVHEGCPVQPHNDIGVGRKGQLLAKP